MNILSRFDPEFDNDQRLFDQVKKGALVEEVSADIVKIEELSTEPATEDAWLEGVWIDESRDISPKRLKIIGFDLSKESEIVENVSQKTKDLEILDDALDALGLFLDSNGIICCHCRRCGDEMAINCQNQNRQDDN